MAALSSFIVMRNDPEQLLQDGGYPEDVYHSRTWSCAVFVGKRYGSKGYPQRNTAQMW
jgi:hypothetical protein